MIVKLKSKNPSYPDLSEEQHYFVLRILNDAGKPYLYSPELFEALDAAEPEEWVTEYGEDHERYSYPPLLNEVGFFEDYFDHKPEQV